ncbi:MAG: dUTP diphosphatase [Dialister sp.]|nr:dUTP diphosphatase [Dialister sp.]
MERGFEIISAYAEKDIHIPKRKTAKSAGYDIESAEDAELLPGTITIVPTGLKAFMKEDEYLTIHIRSSMAIKHGIILINSTGIIDADYYNNEDNEGHIMVALYNTTDKIFPLSKGDRIAQGIFNRYLSTDDDEAEGIRSGGIGSTGR